MHTHTTTDALRRNHFRPCLKTLKLTEMPCPTAKSNRNKCESDTIEFQTQINPTRIALE